MGQQLRLGIAEPNLFLIILLFRGNFLRTALLVEHKERRRRYLVPLTVAARIRLISMQLNDRLSTDAPLDANAVE